jgi:hypothetical protein
MDNIDETSTCRNISFPNKSALRRGVTFFSKRDHGSVWKQNKKGAASSSLSDKSSIQHQQHHLLFSHLLQCHFRRTHTAATLHEDALIGFAGRWCLTCHQARLLLSLMAMNGKLIVSILIFLVTVHVGANESGGCPRK